MAETIRLTEGDIFTFSHILETSDGDAIDLASATSIKLQLIKDEATELKIDAEVSADLETTGKVDYTFTATDVDTPGMYLMQFIINWPGGGKDTVPSDDLQWVWIMKDRCKSS